ncbi:hypothetical protein CBL_05903 [Carabus blaptoides fortunei]
MGVKRTSWKNVIYHWWEGIDHIRPSYSEKLSPDSGVTRPQSPPPSVIYGTVCSMNPKPTGMFLSHDVGGNIRDGVVDEFINSRYSERTAGTGGTLDFLCAYLQQPHAMTSGLNRLCGRKVLLCIKDFPWVLVWSARHTLDFQTFVPLTCLPILKYTATPLYNDAIMIRAGSGSSKEQQFATDVVQGATQGRWSIFFM